jgi:hypothetical protein
MLVTTQMMLVSVTKTPELGLNEQQNRALADAMAKVARHYPAVISEKQQDIVSLIFTIGGVAYIQQQAYSRRKAKERAEKRGNIQPN